MEFLVYSLPEEIAREEALGNFSTALKLIDEFLKKDLPELQRKRLIYEKERIERLIEDYPFSEKEALEKLKEMFEDFSEEEFHRLLKEGILDYIVVNGERRFERRFFHNLAFAKPEYRERLRKKDEKVEKARKILHDRLERLTKGEKPKEYLVRARVTLRLKKTSSRNRVWLPFPKEGFQIENVKLLKTSHKNFYLAPNDVPQRTIYFEGKDSVYFVEFEYTVREWINRVDPEVVEEPGHFEEFLRKEPPHIVFTPKLRWLTREVVGDEENPYLRAKRIYDWITFNVRYSYVKPYALYENITDFVVNNLKGDCGFQALLFITMCRIAGIPARWQSGWYINPIFASPHDWALFYIEPYGWLPADLSFGGARKEREDFRSFYFGNLDGFRMVANDDFMKSFDPEPRYIRQDPTDNQVGEAEGEDGRLPFESTLEVLSFEEV
ncbi:transglutaminase-like domain-containing protein [Thermotoga neapolitana]|jgi:transglutaminase-like putative cysteine protease|uniref:Transglutaminase domain protein n=1 Tax=Thermotoga neapolitana (strain ATCC 49049 / DSM 4359 / NBRC 107923 / NS-E) TaxID=309803 RepID=B9K7D5_THENN|nr:transglutaminase domain-containing protein [Thermotoga neapolitana]ACM22868.1 Transglutaminase domain protein [Thermotoga neapolitana DSM 4359]KFZ22052.1 Transglutaminase domain protein [Thermotoga neapolitana LA10]HBF11464.1 transglutaminase [Thermotoga neapolitana]